jgi:hypothetical protein
MKHGGSADVLYLYAKHGAQAVIQQIYASSGGMAWALGFNPSTFNEYAFAFSDFGTS